MYRIIDGRGTGKTGQLMLLAKENNAYFVCANKQAMIYKAHAYGINDLNIISYDEFANISFTGIPFSSPQKVVIDELEGYLNYITHKCYEIIGYSLSNEE